mmetsp:Transcript_45745/g.106203  ORF Transcript_45745/g.106203 Transcript_45745/m.106203 type:complete len:643 (-) Transcript_45745:193-2121(-)
MATLDHSQAGLRQLTQLQTSSRVISAASLRPRCGWNPPPEPGSQPEAVLRPRTQWNPPSVESAQTEDRAAPAVHSDGLAAGRPESATSTTSRPSRSRARPTSGLSGPVSRLADRSAMNVSPHSRGDQALGTARPVSAQSATSTKTDVLREELSRQKLEQVGRHLRGKGLDTSSSMTSYTRATPAGSTGVSLAGTRPSSPVPPELTEAMDTKDLEIRKRLAEAQNPQEIEEQLSAKERQVLEIRAQINRYEKQLYGENAAAPRGEADVVEDPKRDPERTGPRSPALSSASAATATGKSNNLEAELAWTVRQMEVHRRQIQAHQLQLGALEKRHAEIITVLAAQATRSPAADPADSLASSQPEVPTAERLSIHPSNPFAQVSKDLGHAAKSTASTWSRPSSAGSQCHAAAHRPSSAGSHAHRPSSASSHAHSLLEDMQEKRPLQVTTAPADGVVVSVVDSADSGSGKAVAVTESNQSNTQAGDARWSTRTFSKAYEAERIVFLLTQFGCRRPLRVPFIPMDDQLEGEGRPYLHGSFEVRLCLTADGNDLLVRVGADAHGDGGRVMAIDEFVDRAEASEARRVQRPIAEEGEFVGGSTPFMPSPPQSGYRETSSIQNLLGGKEASLQAGSNNPWKKLFKAHWAPK